MGVLDGIKILELARVAPAELPGMLLADMGAEVLKIETPETGRDSSDAWVRRTIHTFVNRNKRSMTLNMKAPEGQAIFRKLAATADILVEGFRPGVMKRLGADYETLSRTNPRLVYCSLSGFGQDGPYRDRPAHDMNYLSLAGVLNLIGEADRKPAIPLNLVADYAGASLHGALGIVLALYARSADQFVRAANAEEEAARREIEALIRTRDRDDWYEMLVKADVCVGKVYDVAEMVADPQINHRQMVVDVEHPTHGRVRQIGIAIKLSDTPGTIRSAAPLPSEHTESVLKDLGLAAAEVVGPQRKVLVGWQRREGGLARA